VVEVGRRRYGERWEGRDGWGEEGEWEGGRVGVTFSWATPGTLLVVHKHDGKVFSLKKY
jgi:hypothetical protein